MWGVGSTVSGPCLVLYLKGNRQRSVATSGHLFWTGGSYFVLANSLFAFVVLPGPLCNNGHDLLALQITKPKRSIPPRPETEIGDLRCFGFSRNSGRQVPLRLQHQVRHGLAALRQRRQVTSPVGLVGTVGAA